MYSILITIAVTAVLTFIGLAISNIIAPEEGWRNLTRAPIIGFSTIIIAAMNLSCLGLPIGTFAAPLLVVFVAISALIMCRARYWPPPRGMIVVLLTLSVGFGACTAGFLMYGTNWVSFSTDDSATYVLNAARLFDHGYYYVPSISDVNKNQNISAAFYGFTASGFGYRPGTDIALAILHITGLPFFSSYMPLSLFSLTSLAAAACTLVMHGRLRFQRAALVAFLIFLCPLLVYSYYYQRTPQLFGLALLAAAISLIMSERDLLENGARRRFVLASIPAAALCITYAELVPFLLLGTLIYALRFIILASRHPAVLSSAALGLLITCAGTLGVLGAGLPNAMLELYTLYLTVTGKIQALSTGYFATFLTPRGISDFAGLTSFGPYVEDLQLTIAIAISLLFICFSIFVTVRSAVDGKSYGLVGLPMLLFFCYEVVHRQDFAAYKAAMYVQPFLVCAIAIHCTNFFGMVRLLNGTTGWKQWSPTIAVVALALCLWSQAWLSYTANAIGVLVTGAGFSEVYGASASGLLARLNAARVDMHKYQVVVSDANIFMLQKYEGVYSIGTPLEVLPFDQFCCELIDDSRSLLRKVPVFEELPNLHDLLRKRSMLSLHSFRALGFDMQNGRKSIFKVREQDDAVNLGRRVLFLGMGGLLTPLNRAKSDWPGEILTASRGDEIRNRVVAINSSLGEMSSAKESSFDKISLYSVVPDVFSDSTMSAVGRYLVLRILRPASKMVMSTSFTVTPNAGTDRSLPPAAVIGERRESFGMDGICSAHVYKAVRPSEIALGTYVGIDFGVDGEHPRHLRTGLMRLFGTDIDVDARRVVGYARDISVLSDEEYRKMRLPAEIRRFPGDLVSGRVPYSGICEDGWVGDTAMVTLESARDFVPIVQGVVPLIADAAFSTNISLAVDGITVARVRQGVGQFKLAGNRVLFPGRHTFMIHCTALQLLPGDGRRVCAQLFRLGRLNVGRSTSYYK